MRAGASEHVCGQKRAGDLNTFHLNSDGTFEYFD